MLILSCEDKCGRAFHQQEESTSGQTYPELGDTRIPRLIGRLIHPMENR